MKKYSVGYTQGTYDLFHIGHLNLLRNAKEMCDYLIVGVNSDELVKDYKNKDVIIHHSDRAQIISAIKYVDEVIITSTLDKRFILEQKPFDAIFIGDDWKGNSRWEATRHDLAKDGIDVVFLPHTDGISSTQIIQIMKEEKS